MRNTSNVLVHLRVRYRLNYTGLLLQYKNATTHMSKRPAGIMLKVWEEYVLLLFLPNRVVTAICNRAMLAAAIDREKLEL